MSPLARSGGKNHRIARVGLDTYELIWDYEVKYSGSRLLFHRKMMRETNLEGAKRFAKKWKIPAFRLPEDMR